MNNQTGVVESLPTDVQTTLQQTLTEARVRADDPETACALLDTTRRVAKHKIPEGLFRDRLLFGCAAATAALRSGDSELAVAYVSAMERRLPNP